MIVDKKIVTAFILTTAIVAGTALASFRTTTTTESVTIGSSPALTVSTTTTDVVHDKGPGGNGTVIVNSSDADLASIILRVLGIPVSVQEITTYRTRNMGYGEITLAYNLAQASGRPVADIMRMRYDDKMGWGRIAKVLGVKLHDASNNSVVMLREINLNNEITIFNNIIQVDLDDENNDKDEHQVKKPDNKDDRSTDHNTNHGKGHSKDKN